MKFKIGDEVITLKGGRLPNEGGFVGKIVGFSKWKHYEAANVKKYSGKIVQCLIKNLIKP